MLRGLGDRSSHRQKGQMTPTPQTEPSRWQRVADRAWPSHPARWRDVPGRLRPTLVTVTRLTAAAVVSYLISLVLTDGALDLTGPLTALLVVQASAFSTIKMGAVRVGAVLSGVLVATVLSTGFGLTWWSLGAAIATSLLLAKALRLGEQALETPISAMLILGVSNHDVAAETRILNTLIGAAVGVAFNLVYPPAMPVAAARQALLSVVDAAAAPLDAAADALAAARVTRAQVEEWIDRVRAANRQVASATEIIALLKDSRRFNPRALGTVDVEPVLASGLDTLEHCLLAIRALFTRLLTEIPAEAEPDDPYGDELRAAFAVVLHDTADCLRAFGSLVVAEAEGREKETEQALGESLDILRETQAILTELIMVDAHENTSVVAPARLHPRGRRPGPLPTEPGGPRPPAPAVEGGADATSPRPAAAHHPGRPAPPRPSVPTRPGSEPGVALALRRP